MKKMTKNLSLAGYMIFGALAAVLLVLCVNCSVFAASRTVSIDSALIEEDQVILTISASSIPSSDDGYYYIYADQVYEDGTEGEIVASVEASKSTSVSFALNFNTENSNLTRKFIVAVKQGGTMVQVSDEHYITNPEKVSITSAVRMDTGIKGLLVDPSRLDTGELEDLGIQQATYNITLCDIVGESEDPVNYPTIYFEYDGLVYTFNTSALAQFDELFKYLTDLDIQLTVNILNTWDDDCLDLIHPLGRDGHESPGYAFNTEEEAGVKHLEAIAFFLGNRYNGWNGCGQVDNWIVGNEVNARTEQYYMSSDDLDENVNAYHKAFRIFYNGLKAGNGTCRVYNSIDQEWGRLSNSGSFYAREYLDQFNYYVLREGNIDWGLSFHPYDSPLYDPYAWLGLSRWVYQDLSTPYITMQNLYLLTDYMHQEEFLNPNGEVRSISLSEIGFTSYFGDDLQCASIVYAYLQAAANEDIDAFMLYRQTDSEKEMESYIAQGLVDTNGDQKKAYNFYKYIDTIEAQTYKDLASEIIGEDVDSLIGIRDFKTRTWEGYTLD